MKRRSFLGSGIAAAAALRGSLALAANAAEFYVAPNGRDENPGTKGQPFATLQRARDEIRKLIAKGLGRPEWCMVVPDGRFLMRHSTRRSSTRTPKSKRDT